ncbi:MAG: hypothetical protein K0R75_323, partial [Paenibacillaceae bacterium]|nr:hypothetical protein [Paenibacillaceae bacterium]
IRKSGGRVEDQLAQPGANREEDGKKGREKMSEEEKMLLDHRIATLLGDLSRYAPGEAKYEELDREYKMLIAQRKHMTSVHSK